MASWRSSDRNTSDKTKKDMLEMRDEMASWRSSDRNTSDKTKKDMLEMRDEMAWCSDIKLSDRKVEHNTALLSSDRKMIDKTIKDLRAMQDRDKMADTKLNTIINHVPKRLRASSGLQRHNRAASYHEPENADPFLNDCRDGLKCDSRNLFSSAKPFSSKPMPASHTKSFSSKPKPFSSKPMPASSKTMPASSAKPFSSALSVTPINSKPLLAYRPVTRSYLNEYEEEKPGSISSMFGCKCSGGKKCQCVKKYNDVTGDEAC